MAQETWLVIAVGAAFLLLGIAVSPLGWVAILQRRGRADRDARAMVRRAERPDPGPEGTAGAVRGRAPAAPRAGRAAGAIRPARFAGSPAAGADRERRAGPPRRAGGR